MSGLNALKPAEESLTGANGKDIILNTLYKKYLGYANTQNQTFNEFGTSARSNVFPSQIFTNEVPETLSSMYEMSNPETVSVPYSISGSGSGTNVSYEKLHSITENSKYSYIKRYKRIPLIGFDKASETSFYYKDLRTQDNPGNLLKDAIPTNYGDGTSYKIIFERKVGGVFRSDSDPIPSDKYIFDMDAGVVTFYNFPEVSQNNPPYATFWRYEGDKGFPTGSGSGSGTNGTNGADGDRFTTSTTTTVDFNPAALNGANWSIQVGTGLAYIAGQNIIVANNDGTKYFEGVVHSYTKESGQLVIKNITNITGFSMSGENQTLYVSLTGRSGTNGTSGDRYASSGLLSVTTEPGIDSIINFSVGTDLSYNIGREVVINNPSRSIIIEATVSSYNKSTGSISISVKTVPVFEAPQPGTPPQTYSINLKSSGGAGSGSSAWNDGDLSTTTTKNVGIKTETPTEALDVNGSIKVSGDVVGSDITLVKKGLDKSFNYQWFMNNIVSKPPAPEHLELEVISPTSTTIGFKIKNPDQIPFGNMLVPYIDSIKIDVVHPSGGMDLNFVNSSSTPAHKNYLPRESQSFEYLYLKKTLSTGQTQPNVSYNPTQTVDMKAKSIKYENTSLGGYTNGNKIKVRIYFDNTKITGDPIYLEVTLDTFLAAFPPSAPRNFGFFSGYTITDSKAKFKWDAPQYAEYDTSVTPPVGTNNASVDNYKLTFTGNGYVGRYIPSGSNLKPDPINVTTDSTTLNKEVTGLWPGSAYSVKIQAKNNNNLNYGVESSALSFTTTPPVPILTSKSNLNVNFTSSYAAAIPIGSATSVTTVINKITTPNLDCSALSGLLVHTSSNLGSTANDIMKLESFVDNSSTAENSVTFNGFGASPQYTGNDSGKKISYPTITTEDYFTGTSTGFYLKGAVNPRIVTSLLDAKTGSYTLVHKYSTSNGGTTPPNVAGTLKSFYIDDFVVTKTASISNQNAVNSTNGGFIPKWITGTQVYGGSGKLNITFNGTNFARCFHHSTIADVTLPNNNIFSNINSGTLIQYTDTADVPFGVDTGIPLTITPTVTIATNAMAGSANLDLKLYRIGGTFVTGTVTLNLEIDNPSYNKVPPELLSDTPNSITGGTSEGYRVINPPFPSLATTLASRFDHTTTLALNELAIKRALYQNTDPQVNVNNSPLPKTMRYATFRWTIDPNAGSINTLKFIIKQFNTILEIDSINGVIKNSDVDGEYFTAHYRVERIDNGSILTPMGDGTVGNTTSYWMDLTKDINGTFVPYVDTSSVTPNPGLMKLGSGYTNNDLTLNAAPFSFNPNSTNFPTNPTFNVYFRVGLRSDKNMTFSTVEGSYT